MLSKIKYRLIISKIIKYFFVILSFIIIVITGYYVITNQNNKIRHQTSVIPSNDNDNKTDLKFRVDYPDLIGISLEHGPYYINAEEMQESTDYISFMMPEVKLMLNHADWMDLTSKTAKLTIKNNHLELFDDVKGNFNKEYYFNGTQAEIIKNDSIVKSDNYSKLFSDKYILESEQGFILNYKDKTAFFHGKINTDIKQETDEFIINIKSDSLDVVWLEKTGHFLGNVILLRNGTKVEADKMTAIINHQTNKLEKIYTYGNVKITDKNHKSTSEYGEYILATSILTLKDNVKLYKGDNIMSGELLHYNFITEKANLVGASNEKNKRVKAVITPTK